MSLLRLLMIASLSTMIMVGVQASELSPAEDRLQASCFDDYRRLCFGIDPSGPKIEACFEMNMHRISSRCRTAIEAYPLSAADSVSSGR